MIIRNRNRGIKLVIKYNADGIYVRESFVHLTSYLGVLARTMVPIRYNTWRDVLEQLKDKLWDSIEDELMKESQESGISYSGSNDIHSQALATQERQVKFEANVLARLSQIGVATPQSDVSSSNMKSKLLLLPEVVEKPIRKVEEDTLLVKIEPHMKARKCELVVGTRENTVAGGTIVMDCGPNYLVVLDAPYESNTPLPIPILGQATTVGAAVGYQVLWPTHLVNLSLMLNEGKAQGVEVPNDVFGESFKTFLMKEDMDMIISFKEVLANCVIYYIWHLQKKLSDARLTERFAFINPALVSKAGMGETTKENRSRLIANCLMHAKRADYIFIPYNPDFHWVLVALDMRTMTAYYLDPMQKQPCDDLKEIVNMALRIHPPEKQRSSKREPTWVKVVCPRQLGSVECGYYVMRYMKDIIVDPSLLSTKMPSFQSSKSCRSHFDDSHKFSSHDK
ncbi:hypothetical protein CK203_093479 [Vitis vinifera]|uniref:Ubiquitin-like protease family profile domain-containing protein n=1 Tax=Vitis vinifera TaxID=29760 RepID=A0A438BNH4_VITVI|nr:hypothetical protein CK203_093479 [Vitis vinifera]